MKDVKNLKGFVVFSRDELEKIKEESYKKGFEDGKSAAKPAEKKISNKAKVKDVNGKDVELRLGVVEEEG
ncbi:MAG: hypothetical protein KBS59_04090 [Clostridiales bacterium]|nr:hypothetical protein [Clostridiales bacterium]